MAFPSNELQCHDRPERLCALLSIRPITPEKTRAMTAGRKSSPMEAIPIAENPKSKTASASMRAPRRTKPACINMAANAAHAVSNTGARSRGSTLRPLTSINVAVTRIGSLGALPDVTAATDAP